MQAAIKEHRGPRAANARPMITDGQGSEEMIGDYRIESALGQGGMGEVFLAWDERLHRHVAIKRIRTDLPVDEHHRTRFRREARAAARLSHPAIVQIFDILETVEGDCIVMEQVDGHSLAEAIARREVDLESALRLACEIADGLAEAHTKGLVHRDLKPENVMVTAAGHAKILDFGLARMLWAEPAEGSDEPFEVSAALTEAGALVGTVHAMSPEQASGRPVDHRSDLFALGGLLYEMLAGRAPFRGINWLDTLRRVTSEEPEPLRAVCPALPRELEELVTGLLAKDPEKRPQNARLVADTLERLRAVLTTAGEAAAGDVAIAPGAVVAASSRGLTPAPSPAPAVADDLPTGEWPALRLASPAADQPTPSSGAAPEPSSVLRILVLTELIGEVRKLGALDDSHRFEVSTRHDRAARDLLARFDGFEVDNAGGFFLLFERPDDAVGYALAYHQTLERLTQERQTQELGIELRARVGIHLGQVLVRHNTPQDISRGAKAMEVEGLARATAAQVLALASGRQIFLTRGVFDLARRAAMSGDLADEQLRWLAHGTYLVEGADEPLEVFEVGVRGFAPLREPADSDQVKRVVALGDELTLGWRPAAGQAIARRPNWTLTERLGEGGFGEVWLARHKSGERRVFKFCFEAARLRALKREVTLFRLLKDALGHRDDIARILDWHFDDAPYFVESEYTEGGNLAEWFEEHGDTPVATRLDLVAEIAEALGAAHSVGILHKDVKPENVLITQDRDGRPRARLTDFGIGLLTERQRLAAPGFTALGFTQTATPTESSGSGTLGYLAPELMEGKAATVQADVYSLGVLLYQWVVGDFSRTLAPGWRRDVDDDLLADDIGTFVDGRPERRPASALEVAERLRSLEQRRRAQTEAKAQRLAFEESQRRRRVATWVASVALLVLVVVAFMGVRENRARRDAEAAGERATARQGQAESLIGFMLGDLREKLSSAERLEILDEVGDKALEYFAAVPLEELSDDELARRSQALYQIGDVRIRQGRLAQATAPMQESLDLARELAKRYPEDGNRLFELGQSLFWMGYVHWKSGDLEQALLPFERYLEISERLVQLEPSRLDWRLELSYAHTNIGSIQEARGTLQAALDNFQRALALNRDLSAREPDNNQWQMDLASQHNKIGVIEQKLGNIKSAHLHFKENLEIYQNLASRDPENARFKHHLAIAHIYEGGLLSLLQEWPLALEHFLTSRAIAEDLTSFDPANTEWQSSLGTACWRAGTAFHALGRTLEAVDAWQRQQEIFEELLLIDSKNPEWQRRLAAARYHMAWLQAEEGRSTARAQTLHVVQSLVPLVEANPADLWARRWLAESYLLLASLEAAQGAQKTAKIARQMALETIAPMGPSKDPERLSLQAKVLLYLGRIRDAEAVLEELRPLVPLDPRLQTLCEELGLG